MLGKNILCLENAQLPGNLFSRSKISYGQLLKIFFAVAHDPTELNRQGPDTGTQYRSAIFYSNEEQKRIAQAYSEQLNKAGVFSRPLVTQVAALQAFHEAEGYHQDYLANHPNEPYIVFNDLPRSRICASIFPAYTYRDSSMVSHRPRLAPSFGQNE
jgi:peptide-methionine (S)-S-oxide reductase